VVQPEDQRPQPVGEVGDRGSHLARLTKFSKGS
jgi:hypothetical protein